jgi:hypothetical protein
VIEQLQDALQDKNLKPDQPSVVVDPTALELAADAEEEVTYGRTTNRI